MIKLMDLIRLAGITMGRYKVHCATGSNPTPLEAFYDGNFKKWQEAQNKRNFQCDRVLSLIHMGTDKWLFAGRKAGDPPNNRRAGCFYPSQHSLIISE